MTRFGGVVATLALAAFLCGAGAPGLVAQQAGGSQPPEGTAAISGVVTDATTHRPLAGVLVYLGFQGRGAAGRLSRQVSDEKGRFVFTDLPAGASYFINATKFGYSAGRLGSSAGGLGGGMIALTDGQWVADADFEMQRLGSISGIVVDEHNDPVVGAFVRVLARISVAGRPQLAAGATAKTDDRGVYRIPDLAPGKYIAQVLSVQQSFPATMAAADLAVIQPTQQAISRGIPEPPPALEATGGSRLVVGNYPIPPVAAAGTSARAYAPVIFPNAAGLIGATTIELKAGESRIGIDFSLALVPVSSVSGTVVGPADVLPGLVVRLLPEGLEDLGGGSEVATATLDATGRFTLFNVPAGAYSLDIRRTVSEFSYHTPFTATTPPIPLTPGVGAFYTLNGGMSTGAEGTTYVSRVGSGNTAYFAREKLTVGAAPLSDLAITLRRGSSLHGRIVTEAGEPARTEGAMSLVAFAEPADGNLGVGINLSDRTATPDSFEIAGLLPGRYLLRLVGIGNMSLLSVMADGEDHRFKPFDVSSGRDVEVVVTLTSKKVELSGSVTDTRGPLVKGAVVFAFPVEHEQWTDYGLYPTRLRATPATTSGSYRFQGLPAGDYYVVAVPPEQSTIWQDPAALAKLAPSAARVSLAWGDKKTQSVPMARIQ